MCRPIPGQLRGRGYKGAKVPVDFNAFLKMVPKQPGDLLCRHSGNELGATAGFAQMAAEELDVPYRSVDMVMGDTRPLSLGRRNLGVLFDALLRGA